MSVKAGRDEHRLGRVLIDDRLHQRGEGMGEVAVATARRQRDVDGEALALPHPALVQPAGPRVQRPLMQGDVEHLAIRQEGGLRPVAVVRVPVDDGDALVAKREQPARRDGDVVEQAETHRPVRRGVVPRRADQREGYEALQPQFERIEDAAQGEQGDLEALSRHVRVVVDPFPAAQLGRAADALQVARGVHAQDLGRLGPGRLHLRQTRPQVGGAQMLDDRADAFRRLRVVPGVVLGVALVPDDGDVGHAVSSRACGSGHDVDHGASPLPRQLQGYHRSPCFPVPGAGRRHRSFRCAPAGSPPPAAGAPRELDFTRGPD